MEHSYRKFIKSLEYPYCYYAYIIDLEGILDYMHYGLWTSGVKEIKEAQDNLSSMMKSLIPGDVSKILDVGCGFGRTTHDLAALGYDVIGISPDVKLIEMARTKYHEAASRLLISSFEDFNKGLFDLILFQESSQYISDLNFLFLHSKQHLNQKGHILMCDEIKYTNSENSPFHARRNIEHMARDHGFIIRHNENITQQVLKTREVALELFMEKKDSMIKEFSSIRKNAREEIDLLIAGWKTHNPMFQNGTFGYEVFLFQKSDS